MIRNDGTELPLDKLEKIYAKPVVAKKVAAPVAKVPKIKTSPTMSTEGVDTWLTKNRFGDIQEFTEDSLDGMETLGGLTEKHIKKMRAFMKKGNIVNQFNMKYEKTADITKLRQRFLNGKNLEAFAKSNETVVKRFKAINEMPTDDLISEVKDWKVRWNGRGNLKIGSHERMFERNIKLLKQGGMIDTDFQRRVVNSLFGNATGSTNGYTIMNSGMVHTRLRDGAKKISAASAKRIKKSAANTLETNFKFSKFKGTRYERYRQGLKEGIQEVWSNSDPMDASIDWFSTFVHEMGHQIHFQAGMPKLGRRFMKLKGMTYPTEYSRKDVAEQFAESFTQYVFNPEGLQKNAPRLYKWVDETFEEAMKNL